MIMEALAALGPVDARPEKLVEIFAIKDKLSRLADPIYIILTDEVSGEQMRIYDLAEIKRLKQEDPHGVVEIIQLRILFDKADELAAVQGALKAARSANR